MEDLLSDDLKEQSQEEYGNLKDWHKKNPCLLVNSYLSIQEKNPELLKLAKIVLPKMPRVVRGSQNLKSINVEHSSHIFPLNQACDLPWISFDSRDFRNVLLLDIDHSDGLELWEELPQNIRPHLVIDPYSGRSAGIFVLKTPILTKGQKQNFFGNMCHQMVSDFFKASPLPHGSLTKNPFGRSANVIGTLSRRTPVPTTGIIWEAFQQAENGLCWHTVQGCPEIELRDIVAHFSADYIDYTAKPTKRQFSKKRGEPSVIGWNCYLFDVVRFWSYDNNETNFENILIKTQEENNMLDKPLPQSDTKSISRSIHKFMTTRYRPKTKEDTINRGVMNLQSSDIELKKKQKLAALRSSDIKADDTQHKIRQAIRLFPEGRKLTQKAVSDMSGVCLRTVKKHWKNVT
ncbi:hypothetical protein [Acetobacter sp. DsW_059]|uniref:hypothetical protein n=1 Tax=Acetobacter sp. DsW_059 TaxID=1670661 RepID=UPI000A3B552C|nr:hypothetical protein [Acetobacter sp. DsW_059]OUJ10670.1 hypothetical protein HK25_05380 [Acetobacter sp. DsW_059]